MKKNSLILILFLSFNCFSQSQSDMNKEAYKKFKKSDNLLNEIYKTILLEYRSDSIFLKNLKKSQQIWIEFRDAELEMKFPVRKSGFHGTIHPFCRAIYLSELTENRIKTLKEWITGIEGIDSCDGSVKSKN